MKENNVIDDLKSLLEGVQVISENNSENIRMTQEAFSNVSNISLLSEEENQFEEPTVREPSAVLGEYSELEKRNLELDVLIEKFKAENKEVFEALEKFNSERATILERQNELKTEMCSSLEKANLKEVKNYMYSVTYVAETQRGNFDRKTFEKKYPELCKQFISYSKVSAYTKWTKVK